MTNCTPEDEKIEPEINPSDIPLTIMDAVAEPELLSEPPLDILVKDHNIEKIEKVYPESNRSNARTSGYGVTDIVDFNDYQALSILPNKAYNTFALSPYYIQKVGNAWVHVKENNETRYREDFRSNYNHYHLVYEHEPFTSNVNFFSSTPCIELNGSCHEFDPANVDRQLATHWYDHWIKVYAYDYNSDERVFDLLQIEVVDKPIQLWFKKSDGKWYRWSNLGKNTWNLSNYCTSITEVLISSAVGSQSNFTIDDLKINVPY